MMTAAARRRRAVPCRSARPPWPRRPAAMAPAATETAALIDSPFGNGRGGHAAADRASACRQRPAVVDARPAMERGPGRHGGTIRMLMGDQRDIRMMTVYGYARLVGYDENARARSPTFWRATRSRTAASSRCICAPAIAGRTARPSPPRTSATGGRTSPTTSSCRRAARPRRCWSTASRRRSRSSTSDTVRYTWAKPNPIFLPALAGAQPLYIYMPVALSEAVPHRPSHRRRKAKRAVKRGQASRDWARAAHERLSRSTGPRTRTCRRSSPGATSRRRRPTASSSSATPTSTASTRTAGSCPTSTECVLNGRHASSLMPAKTGAGEADLQARYLRFDNYTFLKEAEKRSELQGPPVESGQGLADRADARTSTRPTRSGASCSATSASAARCRSPSTAARSTR